MSTVLACLLSFCFLFFVNINICLGRVRRRCRRASHNFTGCSFTRFSDEGEIRTMDLIDGLDDAWDSSYYNGQGLFNTSSFNIEMNSSQPYYYVQLEIFWTDFYENFTVNEDESYIKYKNVRNNNDNEWISINNVSLDYVNEGSGIVARYGFNLSNDNTINGILTDELFVKIVFEEQITYHCAVDSNCYFSNIQLYSSSIPTLAPTTIPSLFPSYLPTGPTAIPSMNPTNGPTYGPTNGPTYIPTIIDIQYNSTSSDPVFVSDDDESGTTTDDDDTSSSDGLYSYQWKIIYPLLILVGVLNGICQRRCIF